MANTNTNTNTDTGAFEIDSFRSKLHTYGTVRPYLFKVEFTAQSLQNIQALKGGGGDNISLTDLSFMVQGTKIPDRKVSKLEVNWQGYKYGVGGISEWDDWTVEFLADGDNKGQKLFRAWIDAIHNPATNFHGKPSQYIATNGVFIRQIDEQGKFGPSYELLNVWPVSVTGLDLKYSETGTVPNFTVTFTYSHLLEHFPTTDANSNITGNIATV